MTAIHLKRDIMPNKGDKFRSWPRGGLLQRSGLDGFALSAHARHHSLSGCLGLSLHARAALWTCVVTIVVLLPFALWRFWLADYERALLNTLIILALGLGALRIWKTEKVGYTGLVLTTLTTVTVVGLMLYDNPVSGITHSSLWLFPIVASYFVLLARRSAMVMLGVLIILLVILSPYLAPGRWLEQSTLIGAIGLIGLFAIGFSLIESQRSVLEGLVMRDPLTGIGNRLALNEGLIRAEKRMARTGRSTSLILIDVDHFKSINDRHGHQAGDQVLIRLGEILRQRTRQTDSCFRMGGEEFVVMIPDAHLGEAFALAKSLRDMIRNQLGGTNEPITASFGCSELRPGESALEWLARGDDAMYRAKHSGRDRIELEDGDSFAKKPTPSEHEQQNTAPHPSGTQLN